ncbi:hypothetical protein CONPUDRAFT_128770, partial [Coniophora puteana RWD-64-598 SS2]
MWLITGPFDGELGDIKSTKTKLLRTGKTYHLGRKDKELLVRNTKISVDHAQFTVDPYTEEDMKDPSFVPKLVVYNQRKKEMAVARPDDDKDGITVEAGTSFELRSGDALYPLQTRGLYIEVEWRRITCCMPPGKGKPPVSIEACASVGIGVLHESHKLTTHHIAAKFELNPLLMASLIAAAQVVRPDWLAGLVKLGNESVQENPYHCSALESEFAHLPEAKYYKPVFGAALPTDLKSFRHWEPNEVRMDLFGSFRFILLPGKDGKVDGDLRGLVVCGGAEYEVFEGSLTGSGGWQQVLARGKRKADSSGKILIIVGDQVALGKEAWNSVIAGAASLNVYVKPPKVLLEAVAFVDCSELGKTDHTQAREVTPPDSLPDFVPNTHPEEPSIPPPAYWRAAEKAQDDAPTQDSPEEKNQEDFLMADLIPKTKPRKVLTRRIRQATVEPTSSQPAEAKASTSRPPDSTGRPPSLSRPPDSGGSVTDGGLPIPASINRPRLRRRERTPSQSKPSGISEILQISEEPPLKKFKALFEASDPDKMGASGLAVFDNDQSIRPSSASMTQSDSLMTPVAAPAVLEAVPEEEEESTLSQAAHHPPAEKSPTPPRGQSAAPNDQPLDETRARPDSKRTNLRKEGSKKLDTDEAFLKALASTKKGKRTEDDFDREFNQLRISRPDLQEEVDDEPWRMIGDFDDLRNIRGNFMVVVDLDVQDKGWRNSNVNRSTNPLWAGRPNFKKFKKKNSAFSRPRIELMASEANDYGMGSGYWKASSETMSSSKTASSTQFPSQRAMSRQRSVTVDFS